MPISKSQIILLRKLLRRQAQPRRLLHGGFKFKNPNPKPYPRIKKPAAATPLPLTGRAITDIQMLMLETGMRFKRAETHWRAIQARKP